VFVAVPVAAVVGMLVLGVLALIAAMVIAVWWNANGDLPGVDFFDSGRRRRRAKQSRWK
jgi:hypothetical protein